MGLTKTVGFNIISSVPVKPFKLKPTFTALGVPIHVLRCAGLKRHADVGKFNIYESQGCQKQTVWSFFQLGIEVVD